MRKEAHVIYFFLLRNGLIYFLYIQAFYGFILYLTYLRNFCTAKRENGFIIEGKIKVNVSEKD